MGHVPSKEMAAMPFLVDLSSFKGGMDHLMAVALTQDNFPSVDCPLFQQFVKLRCDPSALHWFNGQESVDRTVLPSPPSAAEIYRDYVLSSNHLLEKGAAFPHSNSGAFTPIPICMFRIIVARGQKFRRGHRCTTKVPVQHPSQRLLNGEQVEAVGYLECRPTTASFALSAPQPRLGLSVLLDKSFWNEARSLSILQVACKCYEHFSGLCGVPKDNTQWPTNLEVNTLDSNLPTLRLFQKLFSIFPDLVGLHEQEGGVSVLHSNRRVTLTANPGTLVRLFRALSKTISSEFVRATAATTTHGNSCKRFCVAAQRTVESRLARSGGQSAETSLDCVVLAARMQWGDANAVVVAAKKEIEEQQLLLEAAASSTPEKDEELSAPPSSSKNTGGTAFPHNTTETVGQPPLPLLGPVPLASTTTSGELKMAPTTAGGGDSPTEEANLGLSNSNIQIDPRRTTPPTLPAVGPPPATSMFLPQEVVEAPAQVAPVPQHLGAPAPPSVFTAPAPVAPPQALSRVMQPQTVKLPAQTEVAILLPIPGAAGNVVEPVQVKWADPNVQLRPSSQVIQKPGMMLEVVPPARFNNMPPGSVKTINVIWNNALVPMRLPEPCCYVQLAPGTTVFVGF